MSCGCKTSRDSNHSCETKVNGCSSVDTCGNSYKLSVFDWLSDVSSTSSRNSEFVEVRFKNDRKLFYRNVNKLPLHIGSIVAVEASAGHDIGVVSLVGELVRIQMRKKNASPENALKVYRIANQKDIETWQELRKKENDVKMQSRKIAHSLNLQMKITDVEYQGDGSKITFYYTADNRVDFRQLIKDYAAAFRTKIDMKQIGFRQESAKVGGIGSCGRELCCSTWLTDFRSVNTNAARYQQLSINPQKLAGQCGKLKCCLNYELDSYLDVLKHFPPSSTILNTEKGKAFCIKIDVFKKKMWFAYVENSIAWYDLDIDEVKRLIKLNQKGEVVSSLEELKMVENPIVTADLIQENSVDRFEKKNNNKKKSKSKTDQKKKSAETTPKRNNNNDQKKTESTTGQTSKVEQKTAENKNKKKFHKKKKKTPPKNEGNA